MSSNSPDKSHTTPSKKDDKSTSTTATTTIQNQDKEKRTSLLDRIQSSASSLIQESLAKPNGATLSSDLAHVLDSGNKTSSSSASFSGSTYSRQIWSTNGSGAGSSTSAGGYQNGSATGMSEVFRSRQADGGRGFDASEFDSFQNTGFFQTEDQEGFDSETPQEGKGKGKSREQSYNNNLEHGQFDMVLDIYDDYESSQFDAYEIAWINASRVGTVYRPPSTSSTPSTRLSLSSLSDIKLSIPLAQSKNEDENDGAEVVTLLSDPSFQPGLVTWDDDQHYDEMHTSTTHESSLGFDLDFDDDPLDAEGFPHALAQGLSPAEIQILDSFRQQQPLHQQRTHQTTQSQEAEKKRITAFSLVPDIDSFLSTTSSNTGIGMDGYANDALRNEVLANLIGAEEWLNVDERYNDDVWGYLRPAVEAAAAEIKENEQSRDEGDGDGPAVKRLKMILRHMAHL